MKRLHDQALILKSIQEVREQFKAAENDIERVEIAVRLSTLYACLDVAQLADNIEFTDRRPFYFKETA